MKNLNYKNVDLTDGFWKDKQLLNENVTIDAVYNRFSDTGRIKAFDFSWKEGDENKPHIFWDSDVAKWIEGAACILAKKEDKHLTDRIEHLIDCIEKHQEPDGYFNIYFTVCDKSSRFKKRDCHELYCAGHLIEAAVEYYEATGRDRFLKCMMKYADCIEKAFITERTAAFTTCGHEEIELALYKLYKCTGNKKYLDMSLFFINMRGAKTEVDISEIYNDKNDQHHTSVRNQKEAEGHAVRACYLYTAMADAAAETNDAELEDSCRRIFSDIINRKMYITGGIGSTYHGEAFTIPYDLPSDRAYAETCASIGMMLFAHRMQQLELNSVYADVIEREMYNGMLSGVSLDGKAFFYENPLETDLDNYVKYRSTATAERYAITQRKEVFQCSCCPPNINRIFASIGNYAYGYDKDSIFVNQFMSSVAKIDGMEIEVKTDYPRSGKVQIQTSGVKTLYIRIPSWCREFTVSEEFEKTNGYAVIKNPDKPVTVDFIMTPTVMQANPKVKSTAGKVAVMYGPIVYCAEGCDNTCGRLHEQFINSNGEFEVSYCDELGANVICADGYKKASTPSLYSPLSDDFEKIKLKLIPFAYHANREECDMTVWLNFVNK